MPPERTCPDHCTVKGVEVPSGKSALLLLVAAECRPLTRTPLGERALKPRSVIVAK